MGKRRKTLLFQNLAEREVEGVGGGWRVRGRGGGLAGWPAREGSVGGPLRSLLNYGLVLPCPAFALPCPALPCLASFRVARQDAVNVWELSWPKRFLAMVKKRRLDAGLHEDPAAAWARQAGAERGLLSSEQVITMNVAFTTYSDDCVLVRAAATNCDVVLRFRTNDCPSQYQVEVLLYVACILRGSVRL